MSLRRAVHLQEQARAAAARGDLDLVVVILPRVDEAYLALDPMDACAFHAWAFRGETWMCPQGPIEEVRDR